ncbi:isochorismatase family protein [Polyangium sp. y55x31]|uniref:isochorismatase family protein n=1 Tax=Polyangium sp. y55x31 TaxID=3042688 RepID=UPI0024821C75|nr:isochorismatase family protein [Polyangium sp. y55x31]MDI1481028.1 isochorismatase family protein [Polyangium sp. y55x31]
MGIPSIQPYFMPRKEELPKNRMSWTPDPSRAVLLIHDMQQYFLDYYDTRASPVVELLENIRQVRERCRALGIPVVYTMQPSEQTAEERGLLLDFWGPGLTAQPHKHGIVHELSPADSDTVLTKWRYSAFQRTELLDLLRRWRRDQLIICGVYAHIGCMLTAGEAFMNDVQPFFVADATSDFTRNWHEMAMTYVAQRCGVVVSTRDVLDAFEEKSFGVATFDLEHLRSEVAELLECPASDIRSGDSLLDLGLDSIRLMTLVERLRAAGIDISFVELAERATLDDWWEILSARLPRGRWTGAEEQAHGVQG